MFSGNAAHHHSTKVKTAQTNLSQNQQEKCKLQLNCKFNINN